METNIIKQPQMLQGNSAQPMNEGDKSVVGNSKNMPFNPNVYPNSENIHPPIKKERLRVVEQATRIEIKLARTKAIEERVQEIKDLRKQSAVRYDSNLEPVTPIEPQGQFIDIEI